MIDAIFVPRGVEEHAVRRGLGRRGRGIAVYPTGIGPASAATAADAAVASRSSTATAPEGAAPWHVLVTGLCGALDPAFSVGDILLYSSVVDGRRSNAARAPTALAPLATDSELTLRLQQKVRGAQSGIRGVTVENAVTRPNDKRSLAATSGAHAVDLESFALLSRLREAGASVAVLRVVSDGANDELPDFGDALSAGGGLDLARLAASIVRKPLGGLRLITGGTRALRALRRAFRAIAALGGSV